MCNWYNITPWDFYCQFEFIRRFCLHLLPLKFVKIRHYGFLASRNKSALRAYQLKEDILLQIKEKARIKDGWKEITRDKLGLNIDQCVSLRSSPF
jgi:hypothetical protein